MRIVGGRPDGSIEILDGFRAAGRNGRELVALGVDDLLPLPEEATLTHLPGRHPVAVASDGSAVETGDEWLAVAAVLPVGHLRTLLPATVRAPGAHRLPLFGYTAVVEHDGDLMCAALRTDSFAWWEPARYGRSDLPAGWRRRVVPCPATVSSTTSPTAHSPIAATPRRTPFTAATRARCPRRRRAMPTASAASPCRATVPCPPPRSGCASHPPPTNW